ncbi:hypothetical protein ACQ858_07230 [Variovorax ureilyticus]|uniref:hypothetical protein n=1 Tax=Variovorax ureilyticus TaxID=1836198 RepID=UPI003D67D42B
MQPQVFRPIVFAGLVIVVFSACQPQRPAVHAALMDSDPAGYVGQAAASPVGTRPVTYFGDMFSKEEAALGAKPPELDAPTF